MAGRFHTEMRLLVAAFCALGAAGSELSVEPNSIRLDESAVVTIVLEGSFATVDSVPLPLNNLKVVEGPFESSQFEWVNGRTRRTKILRYRVAATSEGDATVGPIRLVDDDGARLVLEQVAIQVRPAPRPISPDEQGDLETLLRRSEWIAVVPEVSPAEVWKGEQIDATWYVYASDVRSIRIASGPGVGGFWSEDLAIDEGEGEAVLMGDREVRKIPVRRMALFPLRDGELAIGGMEVAIQVLEPETGIGGLFSVFERRLIEVRRSSQPISITVRPIQSEFDAIGSLVLQCTEPIVPPRGPISLTATLEGRANLRSAKEPSWIDHPGVPFEVEDLGVTVLEREERILMRRRWRYLLFPDKGGALRIPALSVKAFDTGGGEVALLRCDSRTVEVASASLPPAEIAPESPPAKARNEVADRRLLVAGLVIVLVGAVFVFRLRAGKGPRPDLREFESMLADPRTLRGRIHEIATRRGWNWDELISASDESGESLRALVSLLDIMEKEPWEIEGARRELRRRLSEFLSAIALRSRSGSAN